MESKQNLIAELDAVGVARFTASDYRVGRVVHLVLLTLAASATEADRAEVTRRFRALVTSERNGRAYIRSIDSGSQLSGEVEPGGFELGFVVTFESLGDRNFYVGEPIVTDPAFFDASHAEFKAFVGPLLAAVAVFDFTPDEQPGD